MSESWWKQRTTEKHPQRHLPFALQSPLHLSPPHPGLCGADLCECYQCVSLLIGCQFCKYRHWQQSGGVEEREVQVSVPAALILSAMFRCFRCAGLFTYLIYSWVFYPFSCYCKWNCFLNFFILTWGHFFTAFRERGWETVMWERNIDWLPSCLRPDQGSNSQHMHVPWVGINPATIWAMGRCSNQPGHTSQDCFLNFLFLVLIASV